jgi:hypothetical protein
MITTRNLVLAAATVLALGTTALSSTEASAHRGGGMHGHGGGMSHGHGGGMSHGHRFGHGGSSHWGNHFRGHRNFAWRNHYRFAYGWRTHFRPAGYTGRSGAVASAPGRGSCLAKSYTRRGAVVFTDRCTQESATAQE